MSHDDATTWRKDRPPEDPEKTKRWGLVTAKPSEFLVHCRRGRVLRSSGQGATCWKWPWDSVAIVPTSLQRVRFTADQVTRERVGVQVAGLAVFRIAAPMLAFRVLNFSYPERAQEKLHETLTEMLVGSTRRLVATLTVDECLERRKAALSAELIAELAPVIGGEGSPADTTHKGWGVVIDTIEIQDVKVMSDKVFAAMQAPHRAALDRATREAKAATETRSALAEAEARRTIEEAKVAAEAAVRARRADVERAEAAARIGDALAELERNVQQADAYAASHEARVRARQLEAAYERVSWDAALAQRQLQAAAEAEIAARQAEVGLAEAKVEELRAAARARVLTAERLPDLAGVIGAKIGALIRNAG